MLLLITGTVMIVDLHYGHPDILAATSRTTQAPVEQSQPIPTSHMQVTDELVWSAVDALSPYEIRGLQRQAQYGDDAAALTIGMAYETGRSVPQSCKKAAEWVERSAQGGNAAAQYNLALRYKIGDGVRADDEEAEKWLRKAADQNYSNGMGSAALTETFH